LLLADRARLPPARLVSLIDAVQLEPVEVPSLVEKGISNRLDSSPSREHAFHCYLLENVFNILPDAADDYIIDGGSDRGIDFIVVDHESRTISMGGQLCLTK
jgi:hypothetical protein